MTAKDIRDLPLTATASENSQGAASIGDCAYFLREIAAQLAELNERLTLFSVGNEPDTYRSLAVTLVEEEKA